jgi:hypothetical protein
MAFGEIKKLVTFKPSDIEMEANDEKIAIFFPGSLPALFFLRLLFSTESLRRLLKDSLPHLRYLISRCTMTQSSFLE